MKSSGRDARALARSDREDTNVEGAHPNFSVSLTCVILYITIQTFLGTNRIEVASGKTTCESTVQSPPPLLISDLDSTLGLNSPQRV